MEPGHPSPRRIFANIIQFLRASTWSESEHILIAHPELLEPLAELIMTHIANNPAMTPMIYPGMVSSQAAGLIRMHEALLARCREIGVQGAFAEMTGDRPITS
ncbi:hypothetical protein Acor_80800 [Acrocarpospora corrugata]|uniref:Uncharacterized protein n=1 Tax=Acrocarpospora corrugata TaxID=35763 RepID=A0A5M3WG01_9ACTN|nr:hypothetical protein [Acrocarpospora corrugata]GES06011.1 hypothetical protein Acor_80800 [Acrocarpospora corrugata]